MLKYCFVIPSYQHSATLEKIIVGLKDFQHKIFVVNDGSDAHHKDVLVDLEKKYSFLEVIHHPENRGKGAAVSTGLATAYAQGYTHGIQIDSDGQHDLGKVAELISLSKDHPNDLISGRPVYDETVPKSRLYGRYATHIWVWIETLSLEIIDSMCGFRSYPLKSTVGVISGKRLGQRMDFDSEIMVRMFWKGTKVRFLPVPVIYPEGGISHFDVWKDNVSISKMHTRLFFGMLPRSPLLIWRKAFPKNHDADQPWHKIKELGPTLGIKTLLLFYKFTGRKVLNLVLLPVVYYYSLCAKRAVAASMDFRRRVESFSEGQAPQISTFQHIYSFASTAIDKFAVWMGDIKYADLNTDDVAKLLKIADSNTGAFFVTSHYGNIEVCRALGRFSKVHFNALVYYENAQKFNSFLSRISPESNLNLISVKDVGPELAIALKDKVDKNEWIFVMGDRQSIKTSDRSLSVNLLGTEAKIPEGPFLLAYLLDVPVYVIHCFREGKGFRIQVNAVEQKLPRGRENRAAIIQSMADQYAQHLEGIVVKDPSQWYNFFKFWSA
jgi:Predicted acyltransferase